MYTAHKSCKKGINLIDNIVFPFLEHTGAKLKYAKEGKAEVELHTQDFHLQHLGFIHGGVISTLLDNTGWYAAVSNVEKEYTAVTMEMKINYLKPAKGKYLKTIATVKSQGRTTSFVTIEMECDGKTVAFATATYAIIEEKHEHTKDNLSY
jgi:uncharacterized protein (TIGR00369 family)